jgi:pimeloyl-ACP methyl ester carboxylesterase
LIQISEGIDAKACIVIATQGILHEDQAQERASRVRNHELHFVPGGHHVHMDDPKPVAEIVNAFLKKLNL